MLKERQMKEKQQKESATDGKPKHNFPYKISKSSKDLTATQPLPQDHLGLQQDQDHPDFLGTMNTDQFGSSIYENASKELQAISLQLETMIKRTNDPKE